MAKKTPALNGERPPSEGIVIDSALTLTESGWVIDEIDFSAPPHFSVSEVGKLFFARSPFWVRWQENRDFFVLDGKPVATLRKIIHPFTPEQLALKKQGKRVKPNIEYRHDTTEGVRSYTLLDVERIAYALIQHGAIDGEQLLATLRLVEAEARLYGHIGSGRIVIDEDLDA